VRQGLVYFDGFLYESTGITVRSSLRKVRLETGEVIQQRAVNPRDFGEGLTEWGGRLVQLTPRRGEVRRYGTCVHFSRTPDDTLETTSA